MRSRTLLSDLISIAIALLFMYAAFSKLLEYDLFKAQIGKSPLIMGHADWIAWLIPTLEICIAIALFIEPLKPVALYAAYSLMFTFTVYIFFIMNFSPYVPCSCGGILKNMGWTEHLIFNTVYTLLAIAGTFLYRKKDAKSYATIQTIPA